MKNLLHALLFAFLTISIIHADVSRSATRENILAPIVIYLQKDLQTTELIGMPQWLGEYFGLFYEALTAAHGVPRREKFLQFTQISVAYLQWIA